MGFQINDRDGMITEYEYPFNRLRRIRYSGYGFFNKGNKFPDFCHIGSKTSVTDNKFRNFNFICS